MNRQHLICGVIALVLLAAGPAQADWLPGDAYKMHYPQLPDPTGWDVDVVTDTLYDDFRCAATGPISDLHFWVSWMHGQVGQITWLDVSLHKDVPANVDLPYSHPDSLMYSDPNTLWLRRFLPGQFNVIPYGTGAQGWYSPEVPTVIPNDHTNYFQINIPLIEAPFIQQNGTIYWIGLHVGVLDTGTSIGWKTTLNPWNDDAAYWFGGQWRELINPLNTQSLDMSFVITPEPASIALLALGGLILLRRADRR